MFSDFFKIKNTPDEKRKIIKIFGIKFKFKNNPQKVVFLCNESRACVKKKQLMLQKDEIQDLYLGLSYGQYGINPKFLKALSFNLCCPGVDLHYSYEIYLKVCNEIKNLKNVFVVCGFYSKRLQKIFDDFKKEEL